MIPEWNEEVDRDVAWFAATFLIWFVGLCAALALRIYLLGW